LGRPIRIQFPGAVYHVFSRGNRGEDIFFDDEDRNHFLKIFSSTVNRLNWLCHAYCLMSNHYHLLIETPEGLLSNGMQYLNSNYSKKFNRKHDLKGHLFQKRYADKLIDGNVQFLTTARYIVRNPIEAHIVEEAGEWKWSSYSATIGTHKVPDFLFVDDVLSCMSKDRAVARVFFKDLVHTKNGEESELLLKGLYSEPMKPDLDTRLRPILDVRQSLAPVVRKQRTLSRPSLEELFHKIGYYEVGKRNRIITEAFRYYAYSQTEIAKFLGLDQSTISKITNKKDQ